MLETTILQHLKQLPESLQQEVLHYTQFLLANHVKTKSVSPKRQAGFLKGTFSLPLPEDFDEPLDDLKEYME
ncbi:DUF2281 domain-containing protein [Nostoc sp. FACHB-280]|uniref:type II toxin-antitoxin system VapB family antitoxin n=1 Tax=Nostoc sp. FACHB-280 TaxID=2692839 RepID=UPI00168B602E|nr:DUF2281 domain-containing protein [Nostoc sp. FACHB-280]MBD2494364.1 DUF2281 domain-containing protein [Nostoc sp. FACHB-280]